MSWDILLVKTKSNGEEIGQLDITDFSPIKADNVISLFRGKFPNLDDSDPCWIVCDNGDQALELDLSDERQIMVHVRSMIEPYKFFNFICEQLGCRAIDTATGELLKD